jgi:hypothetical protein
MVDPLFGGVISQDSSFYFHYDFLYSDNGKYIVIVRCLTDE